MNGENLPFTKRTVENVADSLVNNLRRGLDGGSPSGLTDFSPGSVAGTLVGAIAREFATFYEQLELAYNRSFIDTAEGKALDKVVALLGVTRKPAEPARGQVEFTLKQAADTPVILQAGTRVADIAGRLFVLVEAGNIPANATKSPPMAVVALQPGPEGNVDAKRITRMPDPPSGFTGTVSNPKPLAGGLPEEGDSDLRNRAKHELERAGKSTLTALKYSLLKVEGLESVDVLDHAADASIPFGEVLVVYSGANSEKDGRDLEARMSEAIEDNRAAGIHVRVLSVTQVELFGTIFIHPSPDFDEKTTNVEFKKQMKQALDKLRIGESVYIRGILALAYQVRGILDIAEADLEFECTKIGTDSQKTRITGQVEDVLSAGRSEWIHLKDESRLTIKVLSAIQITSAQRTTSGEDGSELTLVILGLGKEILTFKDFKLDIDLEVRAVKSMGTAGTSQRVFRKPATLHFNGADCATLLVEDSQLEPKPNPPLVDSTWLTVQATAKKYPALRSEPVRVSLGNAVVSPLPQEGKTK